MDRRLRNWSCALLCAVLPSAGALAHQVTFYLVPEADYWQRDGVALADVALPEGTVYLYRQGENVPALTIEANRPHEIPAGIWHWIGEAPGFVTIADGTLRLAEGEGVEKSIAWFVVPACNVQLSDADWSRTSRVDFVSLETGTTHPLVLRHRRHAAVPAGRFLHYAVASRGLTGISPIVHCSAGEVLQVDPPEPPVPGRQHVLAGIVVPGQLFDEDIRGFASPHVPDLLAAIGNGSNPGIPATATVRVGSRVTTFFLNAPVAAPSVLTVTHPALMTHTQELQSVDQGILELEGIHLRDRATVELALDYRPAREHTVETLSVLRCGNEQQSESTLERETCDELSEPIPLRRGAETYSIGGLDRGWHVFEAKVDDEIILGLGDWVNARIDESSPPVVQPQPALLEEMHIYGNLLIEGEPVPGEVRLEPFDIDRPVRRFPTSEEDLLYHMYYFGQAANKYTLVRLPEEVRDRPKEELRGLYTGYQTRVCDSDGYCRLFDMFSKFSGNGRLDFDLGDDGRLLLKVVDARTLDPLPQARVITKTPGMHRAEQFVAGKSYLTPREAPEALVTATDERGEARLRNVRGEGAELIVSREGYGRFRQPLAVSADELELTVHLEPVEEEWELRFMFSDNTPASHAYLLTMDPVGAPDYACSKATNSFGEMDDVPEACLADADRIFVFLHPEAWLQRFSAADLRGAGEFVVPRAASRPPRVRLLDEAGTPIAGAPIELRFADFVLGPNHLLAALTRTGLLIPYRTNPAGEVDLSVVDPRGALPMVRVQGKDAWILPVLGEDGRTAELRIE